MTKPETTFRNKVVIPLLKSAGLNVYYQGDCSDNGRPDLLISYNHKCLWIELKVIDETKIGLKQIFTKYQPVWYFEHLKKEDNIYFLIKDDNKYYLEKIDQLLITRIIRNDHYFCNNSITKQDIVLKIKELLE